MPKKIMSKKPDLTTEKALEILKTEFEDKYEMYMSKLNVAVIKKSAWTGVAFKVKQKKDKTILIYNPFSPSTLVRMLAMGAIPVLIMYLTSWKDIMNEVKPFVENCPEFK